MEIEILSRRPFYVGDDRLYFVFITNGTDAQIGVKVEEGCLVPLSELREDELEAFLSELPHFVLALLRGDQEYVEIRKGFSLTLKRWTEEKGSIRSVTIADVLELLRSQ